MRKNKDNMQISAMSRTFNMVPLSKYFNARYDMTFYRNQPFTQSFDIFIPSDTLST